MSAYIFSHYDVVVPQASATTMKARCKHCLSMISGGVQTNSNFITHLRRKHKQVFHTQVLPQLRRTAPLITKKPSTLQYQVVPPQPAQPTDILIKLIAGDLLPISIVESSHFHKFVSSLDPLYQLPTKEQINTKLLPEMATSTQTLIRYHLQLAHSVCLSVSVVSHETGTLIGITAHFVKDWMLCSLLLSYTRFECVCTADTLKQETEQVITCYELAQKVVNISVYNSLNTPPPYELSLPGFSTQGSDNCIILRLDSLETDSKPLLGISYDFLPGGSPCFVHALHIVMRESLSKLSEGLKNSIQRVSQYVQSIEQDFNKQQNESASVKWISQLETIRNLLNLSEDNFEVTHFSKRDKDNLLELCEILYPIEHAIKLLQKHPKTSAGFIIPVTRGIKHKLDQITAVYTGDLLPTVKLLVEERLSRYEQDETYITASILDPRFKLRWSNQDEQFRIKLSFMDKVSLLLPYNTYPPDENTSPSTKPKDIEDDLFSFMATSSSHDMPLPTLAAETEVINYLAQNCLDIDTEPLQYWKTHQPAFPLLAELAHSYLAIPTSSSHDPAVLKNLINLDLTSFTSESFQMLMLVKFNLNFGVSQN
eukprot:TRINITY_DN10666_c0_g1_i1.p1 TRINITY_DN10666_c0_g1~~TRINITY_DN10666_c0_g1_i1.p1  ORF type:complete len:613 (+),score=107.43 TRINITY_DN10666_c0_g1_i1:54-1841(+)